MFLTTMLAASRNGATLRRPGGEMGKFLRAYPREGQLSWHLSLVEITLGHSAEAQEPYRDATELGRHSGGPQQNVSVGCAFLWRSELAGRPGLAQHV